MSVFAVVVALGVAAATPANVDGLAVVVAGARSAEGDVVEAALRARGFSLLDDDERVGLDERSAFPPVGDRQKVRALLLNARSAYRQLDLELAGSELDAALDEALRLERPEDQLEVIIDALIFQAALRFGGGDDDGARAALRLATRLEPGREHLDEALHAPSMVAAWSAARADNAAADNAVVVVRPRLIGETAVNVIIDGVDATVTEGLLELPRGPHLISLRAEGCRGKSRIVDVSDVDEVIDDVVVADTIVNERQALVSRVNGGDVGALAELRRALDAKLVVALDVASADGPRAIYAAGDGGSAKLGVGVDNDPVDIVAAAIAATHPIAPPPPPKTVPEDDNGGVVAAVSVVGAGIVLAGAGVAIWQLFPGEVPEAPARPVRLVAIILN